MTDEDAEADEEAIEDLEAPADVLADVAGGSCIKPTCANANTMVVVLCHEPTCVATAADCETLSHGIVIHEQ